MKQLRKTSRTIAQTPAPKKERVYGSLVNAKGTSKSLGSAENIRFSEGTLSSIKAIVKKHNTKYPNKRINLAFAKAVVRRGMGAYSSSHRPTISGGKPNNRVAWGIARLNAAIYKIIHGKSKSGKYVQDDDLIRELMKKRKYQFGGMVEHLQSPIITTGMQNSLSTWGGSPISVFKSGGKITTLKNASEVTSYVKSILSKKSYELPLECVVYVPSTRGIENRIGSSEFNERIEEVKTYMTKLFGGNSTIKVEGGFDSEDLKKIVEEDVAKVTAFATVDKMKEHFFKLLNKLRIWGIRWGQEAMGFEFEGDFFSIGMPKPKEEGKMGKGGKISFEGLAKKVAKRYEGMKVEKQYQSEYGKTYDKEEAQEVGRKVAAKVYRQQLANKMSNGGGVGKIAFEDFLDGKLSYPQVGYDDNGDVIVDIVYKHNSLNKPYTHKMARLRDYAPNDKIKSPIQIKKTIYDKVFSNKMSNGGGVGDFTNNDKCIEEVVNMVSQRHSVEEVNKRNDSLIILLNDELGVYDVDILNHHLKEISGCGVVFDDSFHVINEDNPPYDNYLVLDLKTDTKPISTDSTTSKSPKKRGIFSHGLQVNDTITGRGGFGDDSVVFVTNPATGEFKVNLETGERTPISDNNEPQNYTIEEINAMTEQEVIDLANTISHHDRMDEGIDEFTNFDEAKSYLIMISNS